MGKQYSEMPDQVIDFIQQQKMFFVGTAAETGRVNISPKGMDSLKVMDKNRVIWLNITGSANETSAHVQRLPRMTIMFCAFEGNPMILRLYGKAKVIHQNDEQWPELSQYFPDLTGARQIFDLDIDLVQTSCGFGVPLFDYQADREQLTDWAVKKGDDGIRDYWEKNNVTSLDGFATHIMEKNT